MNEFFSMCEGAFRCRGFSFERMGDTVYQIQGPHEITRRVATEIFEEAGHCPVFSQNRVDSQLVFTLVPYRKGQGFDLVVPSRREVDREVLWEMVASVQSLRVERSPVIIQGKQLFASAEEGEKKMAQEVSRKAAFMLDFADSVPTSGRLLDLGCGCGPNSLALLQRGWSVMGIDKFSAPLQCYRQSVDRIDPKLLPNLNLIEGDITTVAVPSNKFDAVLCVDVLPYIDSRAMSALLDKVYGSLVAGGQFLGSLFYPAKGNEDLDEMMAKMGVHFYPGDYFAHAILKDRGFVEIECMVRLYRDCSTGCVDFRAIKPRG